MSRLLLAVSLATASRYSDGGFYQGEYRLFSGLIERHGIRLMKYPNGEIYSGGWRSDLRHGRKSRLVARSGEVYVGMFRDGEIVGYGIEAVQF